MTTSHGRRRALATLGGIALLGLSLTTGISSPADAAGTPSPSPSADPSSSTTTSPQSTAPDYGGFTTEASSTPLRLALYEPAIPIPASPEAELNFSYTKVAGESGPSATARASALWPGDPVGEGLKTIVQESGLPTALAGNGYPAQVNAQTPGTPSSGSQEFLPGMVGRVQAGDTGASARSGYSTGGRVAGDPSDSTGATVLGQLQSGDAGGAVGTLLNGGSSGSDSGSNPLGVLSELVDVSGMSGSSTTDYSAPNVVTSVATSQLGEVDLLGGLVTLEGVTVSSASTGSLGGSTIAQKVTYGGLTIAGTPFKLTSNGIEASSSTTAIPGLPSDPAKALATLGLSIDVPKPTRKTAADQVSGTATGPVITIDTKPIISMLNLGKLPLDTLIDQIPASAAQLQSLLLAALQAHPKIVVYLGSAATSAQTIAPISLGDPGGAPPSDSGTTPVTTGGTGGAPGTGTGGAVDTGVPGAGGVPTDGTVPTTTPTTTDVASTSAPGLPPLGSVPGILLYGGIAVAALAAWLLRRMAGAVLGAGATCSHGLPTGLPDLRKA